MRIRVLIADDHRAVREGLRLLLSDQPDFVLVGEAEDGNGAVELAKTLRPDVLLTDLNMPRPDGIEVAAILRVQAPDVKVLVLTMDDDPALARRALAAGAAGFASKLAGPTELLQALAIVASGEKYLAYPKAAAGEDRGSDRYSDAKRTHRAESDGVLAGFKRGNEKARRQTPKRR